MCCMLRGYCVMVCEWSNGEDVYPVAHECDPNVDVICVWSNWEDVYPIARACDSIDDRIGSGDTFRPN